MCHLFLYPFLWVFLYWSAVGTPKEHSGWCFCVCKLFPLSSFGTPAFAPLHFAIAGWSALLRIFRCERSLGCERSTCSYIVGRSTWRFRQSRPASDGGKFDAGVPKLPPPLVGCLCWCRMLVVHVSSWIFVFFDGN